MVGWYYDVADSPRLWPKFGAGGSASQEALDGQVPTSLVLVAEEEIDEEAKHDVIPLGGSGYFWSLAKATRGARWCV